MQTANVLVNIGGDAGNQVPKYGVSAAEIAVLIAIHGEDAVHDIEPQGDKDSVDIDGVDTTWTNRVELQRLRRIYGRAKNNEDQAIVDTLFPGMAARVFETIDELGLPDDFFKATERAKAPAVDPLDHDGDGKKGGSKKGAQSTRSKGKAKAEDPAPPEDDAPAPEIVGDGIEDMPDGEQKGDALFE